MTAFIPDRSTPSFSPFVTCQASMRSHASLSAGFSQMQGQLTSHWQVSK